MRVVIRIRMVEVRRPRRPRIAAGFVAFILGIAVFLSLIPAVIYCRSTQPLTAAVRGAVLSGEAALVMSLLIGKLWIKHLRAHRRQAAALPPSMRPGVV